MIVAATSLTYRNKRNTNMPEQIACAKGDGFAACELHGRFPGERRFSGEDIDAALRGNLLFSVHAHYRDNNISSLDEDTRNTGISRIKEDILFAEAIGARVVVVHPGSFEERREEEGYERLNRSLCELIPFARDRQVVFTLENMDGTGNKLCSSHRDVGNVLALHPELKLTVDFAHLGMTRQDIPSFLDDFADRIAHFHISGYVPEKPHPEVSLDESQIDFSPCLRRIRDWDMLIAIEVSDRSGLMRSRAIVEEALRP